MQNNVYTRPFSFALPQSIIHNTIQSTGLHDYYSYLQTVQLVDGSASGQVVSGTPDLEDSPEGGLVSPSIAEAELQNIDINTVV